MELNRREFLKSGAVAGAALAGMGALAAAPAVAMDTTGNVPGLLDCEVPPAPITDDMIAETIEADIVVVGAGNAGCVAVATAAENGASVILLQKFDTVFMSGSGFAAAGTKYQAEKGIEAPDPWEIIGDLNRFGGNNLAKWEVTRNWVDYGAETADWIIDKFKDEREFFVEDPEEPDVPWQKTYPVVHIPRGDAFGTGRLMAIMNEMVEEAVATGLVDVRYETPGVQLRTDETGRVTGVIGQTADGQYILAKANKGVILCCGGYEGNPEMRAKYLPFAEGLGTGNPRPEGAMGDGILMATWVGGMIQRQPHCSNIHYDPGIRFPTMKGTTVGWLRVNQNGMRYCNEDVNYDEQWAQDIRQPGCLHYQIFDDNYQTDIESMGRGMTQNSDWTKLVPDGVEAGTIFVADTLEELAEKIGVPAENLVATVARYNELADADTMYDADFGKLTSKVCRIEKAPFYAIGRQASVLCALSGLEVNGDMQVLDANDQPIPGLYAAGNNSGNFFGGIYQRMSTPCMSVGRAVVTARVAAWRACGIER